MISFKFKAASIPPEISLSALLEPYMNVGREIVGKHKIKLQFYDSSDNSSPPLTTQGFSSSS